MSFSLPFPPLPIDDVLPALCAALEHNANAVLVAEPGAGKTTRVPLMMLEMASMQHKKILMLVPRRVAARAAAAQMARLLQQNVGEIIGYRMRMDTKVSARTRVEIITEGVFNRMIANDPFLEGVAAVIFDEFHERSLEADLALALALEVQRDVRPDLRLLVMSATLDAAQVSKLMGDAPQIMAKGRLFPVETHYISPPPNEPLDRVVTRAILQAITNEKGSLLVFLPGMGEILRVQQQLAHSLPEDTYIAPLYGALDARMQDLAIARPEPGKRKIVLATSIAETSLTIEGVTVVIDGGYARVPRYDPGSGMTRLETVRVSQAAADQRRGRAGRLAPGICYRLWAEGQTRSFAPFATPEIREADLSPLLLTCAAMGTRAPQDLSFLDPPPDAALSEARKLLEGLDALDAKGRITPTGQQIAARPLPPRLAHMLIEAECIGAGSQASLLALLLTERGLGGQSSDIDERLHHLRGDTSARARTAKAQARQWTKDDRSADISSGQLLAFAYPERLALARKDQPCMFLLANGKGAIADKTDPLSRQNCLVVAEIQGHETRPKILLAAVYDKADIEKDFAAKIIKEDTAVFDKSSKRVRMRRLTRYGALVLREETKPASGAAAVAALMEGITSYGLQKFLDDKNAMALVARLAFLKSNDAENWPLMSVQMLEQNLNDWLAPFIPDASAFEDISPAAVEAALMGLVPSATGLQLKKLAPTHFQMPTGDTVPIDYQREGGPAAAMRVQQLFGLTQHPSLMNGKVPLTLELLSPAHRPIQTTKDLPSFWAGSWADVRRELRGRYPRHEWPENPATAKPTARAKPRGT